MSRLDLVIFGATGFTGKHTVEKMVHIGKQHKLTWAVAGRNREKLLDMMKETSEKTGEDLSAIKIIVADAQNEPSLRAMCSQAKVVVTCCGPYAQHGEALVAAAIQSKTHYIDCSGEPNFIELMQLKYDRAAREADVFVISACGFESIPTDLGVIYLQQHFNGVLHSVEGYLNADLHNASINSGTWQSLVNCIPHLFQLPEIRKKLYPTPLPTFHPKLKYRFPIHRRLGRWSLPLVGQSAVERTQRYFYERDGKRPTQMKLYVQFDSLAAAAAVLFLSAVVLVMSLFKVTRNVLLNHPGVFSFGKITNGPPEEVVQNAKYEFILCGAGWGRGAEADMSELPPNKTAVARISGTNPGYGATAAALLLAAVAVLQQRRSLPPGGGVLTPGMAFCNTSLVKNLQENGMKFEIIENIDKDS